MAESARIGVVGGTGAVGTVTLGLLAQHGFDDVRVFVKMLRETSTAVQAALDAHKSLDQMKKEKILEPWSKFAGDKPAENENVFIETLYNSLTNTKGPFVKHNEAGSFRPQMNRRFELRLKPAIAFLSLLHYFFASLPCSSYAPAAFTPSCCKIPS